MESVGENCTAYEEQENAQGMCIVACECTGRAATKGVPEEGGTSDEKQWIVQSIGLVEFDCKGDKRNEKLRDVSVGGIGS
jgi:hypothetical protein